MAEIIRADEKNFPGGFEENGELLPCHFSKEEAKTYDFIQDSSHKGHPFIDEETQLRSYAPLGELIKEKEFRDMFLGMDQEWDKGDEGASVPDDLHHMHAKGTECIEEIPWSDAPGDKDSEIKKLAKKGKGGDTIIVMMPENVIYFFGVINDGEISINPLTNFPQFGFKLGNIFKEVIRVGATIAGAIVGGVPGAAIGNYAGQRLTGRNHKESVGHGVKAGVANLALSAGAAMMGRGGMGNMMNMFNYGQGAVDNSSLMNMPGGVQSVGVQSGGSYKPGITSWVDQNGKNMMPRPGGQPNQGGGNLLSSFFQSPMLPAGLNIFSSIMARNADKERYKNELAMMRDEERRNDERIEDYKQKNGFYNPLKIYDSAAERRWDQDKGRYLYKGDSDYELPRAHYAHGGHVVEYKEVENGRLIKGIGDGTSDSIYSKVPPDTFILNAFTISSLGNGSSEGGEEAIQEWFKKIEKYFGSHAIQKYLKKNKSNKMVDVALSVGEIPIFPSHVCMIGYGDLENGMKDLEHLQKAVKAHRMKPTKGALPEESYTIESYLKGDRD